MPKLILVKHSHTQPMGDRPNSQWPLSALGRQRCASLAARLAVHSPSLIVSSEYPRAVETAQLVAEALGGKPVEVFKGLHEHERDSVPIMDTRDLIASMALVFQRPAERILGEETADEARTRFTRAIDALLQAHPNEDLAVVTHGTVLALFVAQHTGERPYLLWRRLGLPSFVVMKVPGFEVVEIAERVE